MNTSSLVCSVVLNFKNADHTPAMQIPSVAGLTAQICQEREDLCLAGVAACIQVMFHAMQ